MNQSNITFADLRLLASAAELGSLIAAARAMKLPKASATRQLQRLEKAVGVQLIHRSGRRFALTEEGRVFLPHALLCLSALNEGVAELGDQKNNLNGSLRIIAQCGVASDLIGSSLSSFMLRHPELRVSLTLGGQDAELLNNDADIAVQTGGGAPDSLIACKLMEIGLTICASSTNFKARPVSRPEDLLQHRFVSFRSEANVRDLVLERKGERRIVSVNTFLRTNEPAVALQAVLDGVGFAVLPTAMIKETIARKRLIALLPEWKPAPLNVNALYAPGRGKLPKIRAYLDHLLQSIAATHARRISD